MHSRTERIKQLKEKRRQSYFLIKYFMEVRKTSRDKFHAAELDKKINREKRRLDAAGRSLSATPRGASHSDIARILGVPKGTIDSGFFYIRMLEKHHKAYGINTR
jgi:DNA-directed RNA polymerase specialized sigma24 family protein